MTNNVRLKPSAQYRALLIDGRPERAQLFSSVMADRGYPVIATVSSIGEALGQQSQAKQGDDGINLIVFYTTDLSAKDCQGIAQMAAAIDKPLLVITESGDPKAVSDAIAAGASFCQPLGVNADRLQTGVVGAIEVYKRLNILQEERDQAVQGLSERKLIDRAKSILMTSRGLNENDAFAHLQKLSMTSNKRMVDIARSIIEAKELLG